MKKLSLLLVVVLLASLMIGCITAEPIYLTAGEKGEYGKLITYNAQTEFEETFYAYYIPYGTYKVTNVCDDGYLGTQVNVYSDEIAVVDGWEEPADCQAYFIKEGETKEIVVPEGYHIEIAKPSQIKLEIKN